MKTLSEKKNRSVLADGEVAYYSEEDVKEFIKDLKEDIENDCLERYLKSDGVVCEKGDICDDCKKQIKRIDKLAGEKLV